MTTKIILQGATGKMGRAIAELASGDKSVEVVAELGDADVVVDFSTPEGALTALESCLSAGVPLVTGTTGLGDDWRVARDAATGRIAVLEAPNMSIGVNLAYLLLDLAAASIGADADIDVVETHHRGKRDAPSGTALRMGEVIASALAKNHQPSGPTERIRYHSLRAGDIPGEHQVKFTLPGETVEIGHRAISRSVFARGALKAAKWIERAPPGLYDMRDAL